MQRTALVLGAAVLLLVLLAAASALAQSFSFGFGGQSGGAVITFGNPYYPYYGYGGYYPYVRSPYPLGGYYYNPYPSYGYYWYGQGYGYPRTWGAGPRWRR